MNTVSPVTDRETEINRRLAEIETERLELMGERHELRLERFGIRRGDFVEFKSRGQKMIGRVEDVDTNYSPNAVVLTVTQRLKDGSWQKFTRTTLKWSRINQPRIGEE